MYIFAIDPGPEYSGYVKWDVDEQIIIAKGKVDNVQLEYEVMMFETIQSKQDFIVMEAILPQQQPLGYALLRTIEQVAYYKIKYKAKPVYRTDIKIHYCGQVKGIGDKQIRGALIDRFGGKEKAIGKKKSQGKLYRVSGDMWQALAVAIYFEDQLKLLKG